MRWLGGPPKRDSRLKVGRKWHVIRTVGVDNSATSAHECLELTHEESQSKTQRLDGVLAGCIRQTILQTIEGHRTTPLTCGRMVRAPEAEGDTTPLTGRQERVELSGSDRISHVPV